MKVINKAAIAKLNPCEDRFNNFVAHYGRRNFTIKQFLALKNITRADKLWVAFRMMPRKNIPLAAADIAELVLSVYESKYPKDPRPRKAIEASRSGNKNAANAAYDAYAAANAAHAAIYAAYAANAAYDAANAANAAANAAYAAANAAHAAIYAAYAANAAYDAANAANAAYAERSAHEKQQLKIILKYWK